MTKRPIRGKKIGSTSFSFISERVSLKRARFLSNNLDFRDFLGLGDMLSSLLFYSGERITRRGEKVKYFLKQNR